MTTEGIWDDLLETLKATNERIIGVGKIVKATPPERLTYSLLVELRELVRDAADEADGFFKTLQEAVRYSPRQTRVDEYGATAPDQDAASTVSEMLTPASGEYFGRETAAAGQRMQR